MNTGAGCAMPDDAAGVLVEAKPPSGSSFFLGLRLLPAEQRLAMYAIYAFCRAVDDVADEGGTRDEKIAGLLAWRTAIDDLYATGNRSHLPALADAIDRFGLRQADFDAVIDGMTMDAEGDIVAPDADMLDLYVDRVASAPGRLSVKVFGLPDEAGLQLAHHLGRALQLTNILRDVDEDAERGRLYLPREKLDEAGIAGVSIDQILPDPRLDDACRALAEDARRHFDQARSIMDASPRECVRAPRLMAAAYRPLLERLVRRGWSPPRRRVSKRKRAIAAAILRYGFF